MSADSRSTHTDALETLGKIHTTQQARDAIHLGVEPVVAGEYLRPGDHVLIQHGKAFLANSHLEKTLGIVDPFLREDVLMGQKFWLIVYPRQIVSLRHVWEHPDFPNSGETEAPKAEIQLAPEPEVELTPEQLHRARLLMGDPAAEALEWIRRYADELNDRGSDEDDGQVTADELIETAMGNLSVDPKSWHREYICKGGLLEGVNVDPLFWEKLQILKDIRIPQEQREHFFTCAC